MKESRRLHITILVVLAFIAQSVLFLSRMELQINHRQHAFGELLAQQLADAAAPLLLANDLVSLGNLTERLTHQTDVAAVQVFNNQQLLVAQSGSVLSKGLRKTSLNITIQTQRLGQVDILMRAHPWQEIAAEEAETIGWLALVNGLLWLSLLVALRKPAAHSPAGPVMQKAADTGRPVTRLHMMLADPNHLLERVNQATADEIFEWYETLLTNAAHQYGGQSTGSLSDGGMAFEFRQADIVERQFNALLTAQLGFALAEGCAAARQRDGLMSFSLKAGLCHGDDSGGAGRLALLSETLSHTAPAGGTLLDIERMLPLLRLRSEVQQEVRLAVPELGEDRMVMLVSRLKPEFQQLIQRQAQQLTGASPAANAS